MIVLIPTLSDLKDQEFAMARTVAIAWSPRRPLPGIRSYRDAIRESRIAVFANNSCGRASHEWLFRWRFAQSRVAQLGLVPTLAAFVSRSAISTPPRFAINYSVRATLAVFAETHRLRTSDVERDQEGSRKPSLRCYTGITYSIKSVGQNKSFAPVHSAARSVDCADSELVVLVLEQDVDRGERSVTARDILLQVELVRIAQFAWHAVASAKEGRSRSPSARELADYSGS